MLFRSLLFLRLLVAPGSGYSCQAASSALFPGSFPHRSTREKEYTIKTIEPTGYVGEYELIQRIAEIQERNVADGYLRLRSDVEREILERQQLFEQEAVSEKPKPQNKPAVVAAGAVAPPATRRREKIGE